MAELVRHRSGAIRAKGLHHNAFLFDLVAALLQLPDDVVVRLVERTAVVARDCVVQLAERQRVGGQMKQVVAQPTSFDLCQPLRDRVFGHDSPSFGATSRAHPAARKR